MQSNETKKAPMSSLAAALAKSKLGTPQSSKATGNDQKQNTNTTTASSSLKASSSITTSSPHKKQQPKNDKYNKQTNNGTKLTSPSRGTTNKNGITASGGNRGRGGSGERGNRGNNAGRGKNTQGRGRHKQSKNDSHVTKRIDGDTIHFEYEIDDDDEEEEETKPASRSNHGNRRKNDSKSSGGRVLNVRASKRLIDGALGRSSRGSNASSNGDKSYRKKGEQEQLPAKTAESNVEGCNNNNSSTPQQNKIITNSAENDETSRGPVLISSKDKSSSPFIKSPMKRWIDDDDGDY